MIRARRIGLLSCFAVTTAALLGLAFARVTAGAPARADLVVSSVSASELAQVLRVRDVVRNVGAAASPRSSVGFWLSSDRARGGGDTRLGVRPTPGLRAGASSPGSATLAVPDLIGAYYLLACADDRQRIRESNEKNNCLSTARPFRLADRTPPTFAGLARATTCIPGPVGGRRSSAYHLSWTAATDNTTPASEIVYDVYLATAPGGEDFSTPTYVTPAGAESFTTDPLPDDVAHYFVIRARDRAGNRETNKVERLGENLCLYKDMMNGPPPGLTVYGQTLWNVEALLHDTFGNKTTCLRLRDYAFVSASCGDFAHYGYWKDIFVGARHSPFKLVRAQPQVLGNVAPVTVKGLYVSCGTRRWLVVLHGAAMTPFTCVSQ